MDIITETTTETIEHTTFVIKLNEAELTEALVNARPLQRQLRKARNSQIAPASNWATAGYAGHTSRAKKTTAKRVEVKSQSTKSKGKVQCVCGEWFAPQGMGPHHRNCATFQLRKAATQASADA